MTPFPRVDLPVLVLVTPDFVWLPLAESERQALPVPVRLLLAEPVVSDFIDEPVAPDLVEESDLTAAVSPTPPPPPDMAVSVIIPLAPFCIEPDSVPLPAVPAPLLSPRLPLHAAIPARYKEPRINGVHFIRAPLVCR